MKNTILIPAILMVLLVGCVGAQPRFDSNLDTEYRNNENQNTPRGNIILKEGQDYSKGALKISDIKITDSRCPKDAQCIWAGELGATMKVSINGGDPAEVILGETTRKTATIGNYTIEFVSVNPQAKRVTIRINETPKEPPKEGERQWVSISPKQCNSNDWDKWEVKRLFRSEEEKIRAFLESQKGVKTYDFAQKQTDAIVCSACSCPRGDIIAVLVDLSSVEKMEEMGWNSMEPIACTKEAKVCSDASIVGREAPFCEFASCPGIKDGDDGRNDEEFEVELWLVPGFVIDPVSKEIKIGPDGGVTVKTEQLRDGNVSVQNKQLSKAQMGSLKTLILSTNFFKITQEDARTCIADKPTRSLEIKFREMENEVSNIGAECDAEKLEAARKIADYIEQAVNN